MAPAAADASTRFLRDTRSGYQIPRVARGQSCVRTSGRSGGMLTVRLWCATASVAGARPSAAAADMEAPSDCCRRPDSTLCAPFIALANCDVLGVFSAQEKQAGASAISPVKCDALGTSQHNLIWATLRSRKAHMAHLNAT